MPKTKRLPYGSRRKVQMMRESGASDSSIIATLRGMGLSVDEIVRATGCHRKLVSKAVGIT